MKIGGLLKTSMIDFPGKVSCVIFTSGCNFYCPYCHNPELVTGKSEIKKYSILSFLKKRKNMLDGVVISGGEPTLQKDLKDFCIKVKEMGFAIKLDTNGSNSEILNDLLKESCIDYVAMDIKTNLENYYVLAGALLDTKTIKQSIDIIQEKAPDYEFRTTCVKPFIDEKNLKDIEKLIDENSVYFLQKCSKNVEMLNKDFFKDNDFLTEEDILSLKKIISLKHCYLR